MRLARGRLWRSWLALSSREPTRDDWDRNPKLKVTHWSRQSALVFAFVEAELVLCHSSLNTWASSGQSLQKLLTFHAIYHDHPQADFQKTPLGNLRSPIVQIRLRAMRRAATTAPAEPPPAMITSYVIAHPPFCSLLRSSSCSRQRSAPRGSRRAYQARRTGRWPEGWRCPSGSQPSWWHSP